MKISVLAIATAMAGMLALPQVAEAAWGQATGSVNMRTCPSTACAKITVVPAGARVWVTGVSGGWYSLRFNGLYGFVSGRYIAVGAVGPWPIVRRPPPPPFGYWQKPWWDDRHGAWYDGRRWYRNGIWFSDPSGFYFGFTFGR